MRYAKLAGMVTLEDVSRLALELPAVVEGERHGTLTWAVEGKVFAWERGFSKADIKRFGAATPPEGPILAVRVEDSGRKGSRASGKPQGVVYNPAFRRVSRRARPAEAGHQDRRKRGAGRRLVGVRATEAGGTVPRALTILG